jgi:asparagine synthase (glutamine-hydrolysing)
VLKSAARGIVPDAVIDRPKGYFPVPGIRWLEGPLFDKVHSALINRAARERGLFRESYVSQLLAAPNEIRSQLGSNVTWQLALLELWLQRMEIG